MSEAKHGLLDGITMQYSYTELGTVRASYKNGCIGFEWLAGPMQGEAANGFPYNAREVGEDRFFVSWHEPELPGFVTLFIDFSLGQVSSSVLMAYATENEQIHFDTASIDSVDRAST